MAAQLAPMLKVNGREGAWSELHGKLADIAVAAGDDPTRAAQALVEVAKDASPSQDLMRTLEEEVSKANSGLLKDLVLLVADELNLTPLGDSEPLHMVDEHGNFCEGNVDRIVKCSAELSAPDAPYAVISIVGAQSSGKSYLLNRLFGTRFPVMDSKCRRCQTTRGIMMSRCIGPSLILLDVQGFDGREKGQDKLFDNQAALFALTVSDLMMVNMPVMDIGRDQGGSALLFRTIFQERTKLPQGITKLLVVLRFYDGETPLEIMRSDVVDSLKEIWRSVNTKSMKFKDYIEVNIVGLPDKNSPEFPKEVMVLRNFLSKNRSAEGPSSSFSVSSSMYWETIKQNKKLDIPSHQVTIARLYCRQLVEDTLNSLNSQKKYTLLKAAKSPECFNKLSDEVLENIKTKYDLKTKLYDQDVRDKEYQYLVKGLHEVFKDHSRELIWKLYENTLNKFKHDFDVKNIQIMKAACANLSKYVDECKSSCEDLKVLDSDHLRRVCEELKKQLQTHAALAIKEERERKAVEKDNQLRLMETGISVANMGINLLTGDFVSPVLRTTRYLISAARGHDSSSASEDLDCDFLFD
ncbi:unnamed protein product [Alopecurus aequalis]